MIIKQASVQDANFISACFRDAISSLQDYSPAVIRGFLQQHTAKNLRRLIAQRDQLFYIARKGNATVGFVFGFYHGSKKEGVFWIEWIGVSKGHQREGIASALLNRFLGELKRRGFHKAVCIIRPSNKPSQAFFRKNGFKKIVLLRRQWYKLDYYYFSKSI